MDGHCTDPCAKQCSGKECGDDACGGTCGECPEGLSCNQGLCEESCQADCLNKECGSNGCGGQCGSCGTDHVCVSAGFCVPADEADGYELDPTAGKGDVEDMPGEPDVGGIGSDGCPEGFALWYGSCVPEDQVKGSPGHDADKSGGCASTSSNPGPGAPCVLLLALTLLSILRTPTRAKRSSA